MESIRQRLGRLMVLLFISMGVWVILIINPSVIHGIPSDFLLAGSMPISLFLTGLVVREYKELKTAQLIVENQILSIIPAIIEVEDSDNNNMITLAKPLEIIVSCFGIILGAEVIKFNQDGIPLIGVEIGTHTIVLTYGDKGKTQSIQLLHHPCEGEYIAIKSFGNIKLDLGEVALSESLIGDGFIIIGLDFNQTEYIEDKDSGIRFSDLSGEVLVRPHEDRLAWELADLDMVLYVMDHIKTGRESYALLSLTDMTVFEMRPGTEIVLNTEAKEESKIGLLYGKVITNIKKMIRTGSMSIDMAQAIAGAKGTVFICEKLESNTRVQVLEGVVEVTHENGEKVSITEGQQVFVMPDKLSNISSFNMEKALNEFSDQMVREVKADIAKRKEDSQAFYETNEKTSSDSATESKATNSQPLIFIAMFLLIGGAIGGYLVIRKRV